MKLLYRQGELTFPEIGFLFGRDYCIAGRERKCLRQQHCKVGDLAELLREIEELGQQFFLTLCPSSMGVVARAAFKKLAIDLTIASTYFVQTAKDIQSLLIYFVTAEAFISYLH